LGELSIQGQAMNAIDTEYNNCYDAARMELSRENHATVEKIILFCVVMFYLACASVYGIIVCTSHLIKTVIKAFNHGQC
jgi:hypothetical protein